MGSKVMDSGFQGTGKRVPMYWTVGSKVCRECLHKEDGNSIVSIRPNKEQL